MRVGLGLGLRFRVEVSAFPAIFVWVAGFEFASVHPTGLDVVRVAKRGTDLGSGAGLPGIVIAIILRDKKKTLK